MTFRLSCGDVMPGCNAHFENTDRDLLMQDVVGHAQRDHGIHEIDAQTARVVSAHVLAS